MIALDSETDFTCLVSEDGTKNDTIVVDLKDHIICNLTNSKF